MRETARVLSIVVMILGGVLVLVGGGLAIWGRASPLYILAGLMLMLGLMLLMFGGAGVSATGPKPPPSGSCLACGYDRSGLPSGAVCPECGKDELRGRA